jgi:hypothetical protein
LAALGLGFLQAQDIGLVLLYERHEVAFLHNRPNAVYVPGIDLHSNALACVEAHIMP